MATVQMIRSKQESTWATVFPMEQRTREQSLLFVKKLLALGISSITYLRSLFPEGAYGDKVLDGLKLKMLLDTSNCRTSNLVVSWMKGCFDAIENQYLRQLTFAIYEVGEGSQAISTIETYTFKFRYTQDGEAEVTGLEANTNGSDGQTYDVRKSTEKMLRTILLLTQTLKPLPRKIHLAMKLGYYDDVTPRDYEPPGFKEGGHETFQFNDDPVTIRVGDIATRHHTLKVRMSVDRNSYCTDELSPVESKNPQNAIGSSEVQNEDPYNNPVAGPSRSFVSRSPYPKSPLLSPPGLQTATNFTSQEYVSNIPLALEPAPSSNLQDTSPNMQEGVISQEDQQVPHVPTQELDLSPDSVQLASSHPLQSQLGESGSCKTQTVTSATSGEDIYPLRCPCGANVDDGLMILCDICKKWQHAVCFDVMDNNVPEFHVCEMCSSTTNPCTDPSLITEPEVSSLCLYRRSLMELHTIQDNTNISTSYIAQRLGVDITTCRTVLQRLLKNKILKRSRGKKYSSFVVMRKELIEQSHPYLQSLKSSPQVTTKSGSQTPGGNTSDAGYEGDVTPDLEIGSLRKSLRGSRSKNSEVSELNSPDISVDVTADTDIDVTLNETDHTPGVTYSTPGVTYSTQDVTVGSQAQAIVTQSGVEGMKKENEEEMVSLTTCTSPAVMPFENTMDILDSATPSLSTQDLVLKDVELKEMEQNPSRRTTRGRPRSNHQASRKSTLLSRRKRTLTPSTNMSLNEFEISMSQDSESQPLQKRGRSSVNKNRAEVF